MKKTFIYFILINMLLFIFCSCKKDNISPAVGSDQEKTDIFEKNNSNTETDKENPTIKHELINDRIRTNEYIESRHYYYQAKDQKIHSRDEWFDESGQFRIPFDINSKDFEAKDAMQIIVEFYIPTDIIADICEEDLLRLTKQYIYTGGMLRVLFNDDESWYSSFCTKCSVADELQYRKKAYDVIEKDYKENLNADASKYGINGAEKLNTILCFEKYYMENAYKELSAK